MAANIIASKDGFVHLKDFKDVIDTSKVVHYTLKHNKKDGTIKLKFYDSKKKVIKPYVCGVKAMSDSIYQIKARIGNKIASSDIALSPVGEVLVNYFSLTLKDLYDFSDTLPSEQSSKLNSILAQKESVPKQIIQVCSPKEESNTFVLDIAKERIFKRLQNSLKNLGEDYAIEKLTLNSIRIGVVSNLFSGIPKHERRDLVQGYIFTNDPTLWNAFIWSIYCITEDEALMSIEAHEF